MSTPEPSSGDAESSAADSRQLPEFVDWIAATIIAIAGLALTVGGSALTFVTDRELLEEGVESGQITVVVFQRDLTEAEMLEFTIEVITWTGIGLLVTGIALVVFAIGYVAVRHRAYRRTTAGESAGSYRAHAVLGAVATTLLSFIPFSPVLGGGVAGYLEHHVTGRSVSVGALSGVLAMLPVLVILVFVTGGLFAGFSAIQESGMGLVTTATMLLVLLFVAAFGGALGALGGFVGGHIADR